MHTHRCFYQLLRKAVKTLFSAGLFVTFICVIALCLAHIYAPAWPELKQADHAALILVTFNWCCVALSIMAIRVLENTTSKPDSKWDPCDGCPMCPTK